MHGGSSQLAAGVREGDVIAGKYRVDGILGAGGMGVVVAARHVQLGTRVAIKFLLPEMLSNGDAVGRFAREARAAVRITSEHVARVLDVGTLESGAPYMVMEYLEGGDLAGWLRRHGALPVEQAVDFVLQACVAVADAHALGIVHRDLKPANLFCVRRSDGQLTIKVIDFGISKLTDIPGVATTSPEMSVTRTVAIMGSPLYMSPEQMQSPRDVDALTDIWALGVVLFELLTGKVPFGGETFGEVAVKVATQPPPAMRPLRADMPPGLEAVIRRCLQPDRHQRYRNVAELAQALVPFGPERARASVDRVSGILQTAGLSARAIHLLPAAAAMPYTPESIAPVGRSAPGITPRSHAAVAGVLGVLTVLGVAAGLAFMTPTRADRGAGAGPAAASSAATAPGVEPRAVSPAPHEGEGTEAVASAVLVPLPPAELDPAVLPARRAPASAALDAAAPAMGEPSVAAPRAAAGYKEMPY